PPRGATATFATLQRKIFTPGCATLSCHGAGNAGGMTLAAGAAYANLVGVPSSNSAALAAGLLRVAPGDPDRSLLLRKLEGTLAYGTSFAGTRRSSRRWAFVASSSAARRRCATSGTSPAPP